MDFIVDNYIWFIVGGIVILMAIIGYFADKTDFGRKELRKRVEKEPKMKKEVVAKEVEEQEIEETEVVEQEETVLEEPKKEKKKKKEKPEKKKKSKEKKSSEETVENEEKNDNIVNIDEMFNDPIIATNADEVLEENTNIDESLFAPLTDTLPPLEETVVSEEVTVEPTVTEDFTEVSVEPFVEEPENLEPVAEEEDIWKF